MYSTYKRAWKILELIDVNYGSGSRSGNEIPLHTSQNGHYKQINKQVLAGLWRKGNPSALLVGMQTGTATMENSMEFPQKTENGTAFWPGNSTAEIIP